MNGVDYDITKNASKTPIQFIDCNAAFLKGIGIVEIDPVLIAEAIISDNEKRAPKSVLPAFRFGRGYGDVFKPYVQPIHKGLRINEYNHLMVLREASV